MEKKRKGGAEKLREKKKKALAYHAATSRNILDMFVPLAAADPSGPFFPPAAAGPSGPVQSEEEEGESVATAAMAEEQEIGGGDGRCVLV